MSVSFSKHQKSFLISCLAFLVLFVVVYSYLRLKKNSEGKTSPSSLYDDNDHFFQNRWTLALKTKVIKELENYKNYFIYDETLLGYIQLNDVLPWNTNFTIVVDEEELKSKKLSLENSSSEDKGVISVIGANFSDEKVSVDGIEFDRGDIFPLKDGELKGEVTMSIKYPQNPENVMNKLYADFEWNVYCKSMEKNKKTRQDMQEKHISTWTQIKYPVKARDLLENVWIINLDKRTDRWNSTLEKLAKIGITNPQKWTAIDATNDAVKEIYEEIFQKHSPDHLTRRELACYLSHYSLWAHLRQKGVQYALILEDDIAMPDIDGESDIQAVLDESLGFNILFLGHCLTLGKDIKRRFYDHLTEKGAALCLHAYAVSKLGIDNLIEYANSADVQRQADIVTRNFCTLKLCYLSHSKPASEDSKYWGEGIIVQDRQTLGTDIGVID